jgi:3-oxoacyl-(acyl-carrier-protein) synthase
MNDLAYWNIRERLNLGTPRVVVTGIGLVTAFEPSAALREPGRCREENWRAIREGRTCVRRLTLDGTPYLACGVDHGPGLPEYGDGDAIHLRGMLHTAGDEAYRDAGLGRLNYDRDRAACLIGLSKGLVGQLGRFHRMLEQGRGDDPIYRWSCEMYGLGWPNFAASELTRRYGLRGPCLAPVAACATGLVAAIQGAELIRIGACDLALVGAVDASIEPMLMASFRKMKVLARHQGDARAAARPWDRQRSGFVVGEGGAVLVLERDHHARARGVLPYAEFVGGAIGSDAYHVTDQSPDPSNLANLIRRALDDANLDPVAIDYVNIHGTATRSNDPLECRAIRRAFGSHADSLSCSANKAQIGHLLGAAGAAELAITCLAMRDGFVPPTLNLDDPDPACDLDGTPHVGRNRDIRAALKLSIGFGGHLAAVVLRRPDGPRREALPRG